MTLRLRLAGGTALALLMIHMPVAAQAQSSADLQRQIDALRAQVEALTAALAAGQSAQPVAVAPASAPASSATPVALAASIAPPPAIPASSAAPKAKAWYEKLSLRGYTQMRYNGFLSGDDTAAAGVSRLRSVHDSSISDRGGFSLRRARLVLQGDVSDRVSLYLQSDFATAVNNQAGTERREGFAQLRDAYADVFLDKEKSLRLRFGQSKVPYGWENMQSSSNRLTLDRSDAINSAVPSERDLGVVGYYTPPSVQKIWDRLGHDGQKLFGNYGAFGVGVFNGQGTNRTEQNRGLMKVAFATWPFALDGLGDAFEGQVFEIGGSAMLNKVQPELRSGAVSTIAYEDNRVGLHAMLYPQPFGIQAEWNWGKGPEYDRDSLSIETKKLRGGYVQMMYRLPTDSVGALMPYGRWQHYRGGWKASTNAPRLETDEFELGLEWQPWKALEFTVAYARMKRAEADERRTGRAEGDLIRTQVQWNY
ncbi:MULTISPECIES: porin [Sphingobium]|uniref:Porin n=1 Tax=Sphingobium cupriresistens LL01 TaxID=1420583 RepID=A0A0J7XXB8_9SPHN|nr:MULTISPECIES: porin [Sphingobium]KMS55863.1 porin [Sphingobium cupriresistens LL01]MBJ7378574.1 porin [Sphingobium sp.]